MSTHTSVTNSNGYLQPAFIQMSAQPFVSPAFNTENNNKFLGIFTASHLSICLLVSGFGLIVTGLLGVVSRISSNAEAFQAVGISLICFGSLLIIISIAICVFAIRWGRKKVHVLGIDRPVNTQPNIIQMFPIGYSLPLISNSAVPQTNNTYDNISNTFTTSSANQTFYTIPMNTNSNGMSPQFVLVRPSAPPQSPDSTNN